MHDRKALRTTRRRHPASSPAPARRNSACRGQAMVEFMLVVIPFFILAFAVMDFSWVLFNLMNMQDAVHEAGRYAVTGNHLPDPKKPGVSLTRTASITQVLYQSAAGATIDQVVISSSKGGVGSAGGPSDTVTIQAVCHVPSLTTAIGRLFSADNSFHFTVSSTFKNEPFSPTQTK